MLTNGMMRQAVLSLAVWAFGAVAARAADVAYVNMETVFEEYYKTVRANAAFEQKKKDFEDRVGILRDELRGMVGEARKLEEETANELLSQEARDEAQRKLRLRVERLRAKEEEFGQFQRNGMRELNKSRVTAEEELIEDITQFVREYCRNKGYRVVYDVNGRSLNRVPVILLHPAEDEITAVIVTEMNQGKEEERAKAKAELEALRRAGKSTEEPAAPAAQ